MAPIRSPWITAATVAAVATLLAGALPARGAEASAEAGKALFTGARAAQNGGAPCGACHALGGESGFLAASLGPDLARSFEGMPAEAVDGMLEDLPFPTMAPIYAGHPLTPAERADLAAFLVASGGKPPPDGTRVGLFAGLVAAGCFVALGFASRRRKGSTRAQLQARPPSPEPPPLETRTTPVAPGKPVRAAVHGGTR